MQGQDFIKGVYVTVPGSFVQGVVTNRSAEVLDHDSGTVTTDLVSVRYLGRWGGVIDSTHTLNEMIAANPDPVDVEALKLERDQALDRIAEMLRNFSESAKRRAATAARKSKNRRR